MRWPTQIVGMSRKCSPNDEFFALLQTQLGWFLGGHITANDLRGWTAFPDGWTLDTVKSQSSNSKPNDSVKLERYEVAERVTRRSKNHDRKKALRDANECIPAWL